VTIDEGAISCYYEWMPKGLKKGSAACRWMEWNVSMSMIDAMERSERGPFVIQYEKKKTIRVSDLNCRSNVEYESAVLAVPRRVGIGREIEVPRRAREIEMPRRV